MKVGLKKMTDEAEMPSYATTGSAGFDLKAVRVMQAYKGTVKLDLAEKMGASIQKGYITLRPGERALIGTALKVTHIPTGYEIQIRNKSGISLKKGLQVLNSPGTIDEDYRGEIMVIMHNTTPYLATINFGEYIAQGVLAKVEKAEFEEFDSVATMRGEGGFGSTGNGK